MTSEKETSKARTPEQIRNKLNELQKILVLFPPGRMGGARTSIRDQIKILYWALGELDDKELDIK
jgi:hypothetical protein